MTRNQGGCTARWTAVFSAALLALMLTAAPPPVLAQGQGSNAPADAITPVEEFARQVEELKKSFADLGKKIDDTVKTIDSAANVGNARKDIEALRNIVGELLGSVSDNGAIAELGNKALTHGREKVKSLERDTRFTREEQQLLLGEWRKLVAETERATEDLSSARKEFVELLRTLQTREDFIDELMQIRRAAEALNAIRQLTRDIRTASDSIKKLISAIKPPGV